MKKTKKSLLASSISLVLCLALMVGTTFAWFTSSVKSNDNTITAGTLNMKGYAYSSVEKPVDGGITVTVGDTKYNFGKPGQDLKDDNKASIDDRNFNPKKISAKLYEVKNEGTLAFKFRIRFINCFDGGLGKELWFAFVPLDNNNTPSSRVDKNDLERLNKYEGEDVILEKNESQKYILLYGLKEGKNENYFKENCKGCNFNFDIEILATQKDGEFPTIPEDEVFEDDISTDDHVKELMKYINNGNDVDSKITEDVKLENIMTLEENQTVKLDIAENTVFEFPNQVKSEAGFNDSRNNNPYVEKAAITVKKGATLELTGKGTLKSDDYYTIRVEEGGTLKIKDINIESSNGYKGGIYGIYSRGDVAVENVKLNVSTDNEIKSSSDNPSPLGGSTSYGIYAAGGTLTVDGCTIDVIGATNGNTGNGANGIYVNGAKDVVIQNTKITGTGQGTSQNGIYCFGGSIKLISNVNIDIKGTAVDTWKTIERIEKSSLKGSQYSLYNRSGRSIDVTNDTKLDGNTSGKINRVD